MTAPVGRWMIRKQSRPSLPTLPRANRSAEEMFATKSRRHQDITKKKFTFWFLEHPVELEGGTSKLPRLPRGISATMTRRHQYITNFLLDF